MVQRKVMAFLLGVLILSCGGIYTPFFITIYASFDSDGMEVYMEYFYESYRDLTDNQVLIDRFSCVSYPTHIHNSFELLFITKGMINVTVNNVKEIAECGSVAFISPNDMHSYNTPDYSEGIVMFFQEHFITEISAIFLKKTLEKHVIPIEDFKIEIFCDDYQKISGGNYSKFFIRGYIQILFYEILSKSILTEKVYDVNQFLLQRLLTYIQNEYDKGLNLNETAEYLHLSRIFISKYFKENVGCSFHEYLIRLKIQKAKNLLINSEFSVLDIAIESGFETHRNFNRVFLKFEQCSPSEFRKKFHK
jgi:YesN/AraC family two-component response regulator